MITVCDKELNITRGEFAVTNTSAQQFEIKKKWMHPKAKLQVKLQYFPLSYKIKIEIKKATTQKHKSTKTLFPPAFAFLLPINVGHVAKEICLRIVSPRKKSSSHKTIRGTKSELKIEINI